MVELEGEEQVVLDLGRRPEARFLGGRGGEYLREAEVGFHTSLFLWGPEGHPSTCLWLITGVVNNTHINKSHTQPICRLYMVQQWSVVFYPKPDE